MLENETSGGTGAGPDKAQQSLWRAVPDAIRGSREDYTRIPLPRAIVLLAIPMMLELVMESTFGLVDIYFVGKLGPPAIAAVGLTGSVIIMVFAIVMGLSMGTTATVARRIGGGRPGSRRIGRLASDSRRCHGRSARELGRLPARSRPAALDGREPGHRSGLPVHCRALCRLGDDLPAVPQQRDLPWIR